MSDEAHFQLSGYVNKHKMHYWSNQKYKYLHPKPLNSPKVTFWLLFRQRESLEPTFLKKIVGTQLP